MAALSLKRTLSELWWALPRIGKAGQGRAFGVLSVWVAWDWMLRRLWHPVLVRAGGVMRYRLIPHRGAAVTLKDGTSVARGDLLVELHFDNLVLMRDSRTTEWSPWETMRAVEADFAELRRIIAEGRLGAVSALYAATMFYAPARRFGFELRPVPHTIAWSLRRYFLIGLVAIYHRDGWKEFDRMRKTRWPAEIWISVKTLEQRRFATP